MLWGLPPIHFGKEDGVERTLLRVACQGETFKSHLGREVPVYASCGTLAAKVILTS